MNRHRVASINIRRRYLEGKRRAGMRGFPHSNEPEETMMVELWAGGHPELEPCDMDPDEMGS
jgi:hypothetical protein